LSINIAESTPMNEAVSKLLRNTGPDWRFQIDLIIAFQ